MDDAPQTTRLPLTITLAGLTAFGALFATGGGNYILPILAIFLLLSYVSAARMTVNFWVTWGLRAVVYTVIGLSNSNHESTGIGLFLDTRVRDVVGEWYAFEFVLRAWRQPDPEKGLDRGLLVFPALMMLSAGNTFETGPIRWLTFFYLVSMGLSLRAFRPRAVSPKASKTARRAFAVRISTLALVLIIGATAAHGVLEYQNVIVDTASRLLGDHPEPRQAGMSSTPTLGSTFNDRGSDNRVLRLDGYNGDPHLRGLVFDTYDHGSWLPGLETRDFLPRSPQSASPGHERRSTHVTCYTEEKGILFAPLNVESLETEPGVSVVSAEDNGGPIKTDQSPPYEYTIATNRDQVFQGPFSVPRTAAYRAKCLAVPPEIAPGVHALASAIGRDARDPRAKIEAVVTYLLANHRYSLTTDPGRGDPVSNFLLQKKSAHCEYFASAAVILLRCLGVPARYATGFVAHESTTWGSKEVRQWDAHAWAEAWVDGVGWVTVDATPALGRPDENPQNASPLHKLTELGIDAAAPIRKWISALTPLQQGAIVACITILYLGLQMRNWRRSRNAHAQTVFAYTTEHAELTDMEMRFNELLKKHAIPCPDSQTWGEHFQNLERESLLASPPVSGEALIQDTRVHEFVEGYNSARFGQSLSANAIDELNGLLDGLEAKKAAEFASRK